MSKNRKTLNKPLPKRILILCEGESEKIYINGYQSKEENRRRLVAIEMYQPTNFSPYGLLTEAKKKKEEANREGHPFIGIWIVFDRDKHPKIPTTFNEARDSNIKIAFSLICFEYWILLHFKQTKRYFKDCDAIVSYLKKNCSISDYGKTNYYPDVKDLLDDAINNAKWLHLQNKTDLDNGIKPYNLNAYTDFDKLIDYLKKIKI